MSKQLLVLFCIVLISLFTPRINLAQNQQINKNTNKQNLRLVTLSPHLTELVFDLGHGKDIVATVDFSDYPALAQQIPRIGNANKIDFEQLLILKPDLVLVWKNVSSMQLIEKLQLLKIKFLLLDTSSLAEIMMAMEQISQAIGETQTGRLWQIKFRQQLDKLKKDQLKKEKIKVFYQIWQNPLMTLGGKDIFNEIVELCRGENVFNNLPYLAAKVSLEAVLAVNPELIIVSGMEKPEPEWLNAWKKWEKLPAVKYDNLFDFPPDLLQRQSQRILQGAEMLCAKLDIARKNMRKI